MAKQTSIPFETQHDNHLGEINITTTVLETIAAKAATKVEGIYNTNSSFQKISGSFFSLEREKIGAKVRRNETSISIDLDIQVKYGYSVPEVAMQVQSRVKEQILFMTDLVIDEVNVHVLSIETDNAQADFFHLDDENGDSLEK
ncbi:Asp23/Gls24 family envelope stress response protein [Aerococcaceae bacterium zg-ZUI334]|uniref:Asp23/Gls24 family envelope stress response protein n=1 Tax=Aerococcaceae TaxID=186827 RepID=UPI0013BDCFF4|nr:MULTISPECIES: Asp23/Gls24 family envelope stress response protein [unclassified Facklamia]MBR7926604.1 Asp23/Gls24 family envelope stress response protein [Aerococcaceae bacterium zg-ZUI334]MBS4461553.1 Asp23/Gls24 family envelope stress response protein [Aerococcaceae bacterium zg-B36]QQD65195.1 Asp23/Gls24 family envelope stress response protein [Aerococcaceae bacterium zg-252]NEW63847.1 Asp23/Gls24 family envelope stress response protein [Facklamia sp. 252]NEW67318.1 Asp23/Gls24 family e